MILCMMNPALYRVSIVVEDPAPIINGKGASLPV
jgi:hypothetical protein